MQSIWSTQHFPSVSVLTHCPTLKQGRPLLLRVTVTELKLKGHIEYIVDLFKYKTHNKSRKYH